MDTEKLTLIDWILHLEDEQMIEEILPIRKKQVKGADSEHSLTAKEQESIARGLSDYKQGKVQSHAAAKERYEKYLCDYLDRRSPKRSQQYFQLS